VLGLEIEQRNRHRSSAEVSQGEGPTVVTVDQS